MNLIFCLAWKVLRLHSMCVYNNNEQYAVDGNGMPHPILCDHEVDFGAILKQQKMKMGGAGNCHSSISACAMFHGMQTGTCEQKQ